MYRGQTDSPRVTTSQLARLRSPAEEESPAPDVPPSPAGSTDTPVLVSATPRSDTPPSSTMGGTGPPHWSYVTNTSDEDSWIAVTPSSDDGQSRLPPGHFPTVLPPDLALAVEGLRIHEHEESFQSEGEDDDEEDVSIPPSEDSSLESDANDDDLGESSDDEETILAPRTLASLGHPLSDEALHASLSALLRSKEPTMTDETQSPRRMTAQGPMGMETLSLVTPDELATRTSRPASSRASSSRSCTSSRPGKKSSASRSKRAARSSSKSRSKENGAQVYALWTAAITAGFLVGFGAGYAWKEYLTGRAGEDVRRVGCAWCGDGKR